MSTSANSSAPKGSTKVENPGTITSDSLAAESIESGGAFASTSSDRGVSNTPSKSTTTNTTDTSGATELNSAPSRAQRDDGDDGNEYSTGSSEMPESGRGGSNTAPAAKSIAPSAGGGYAASYGDDGKSSSNSESLKSRGQTPGSGSASASSQRRGEMEEGFDAPNASFNNEIGTQNDPGRHALRGFQEQNVPHAGGRADQVSGDGQFDALGESEA